MNSYLLKITLLFILAGPGLSQSVHAGPVVTDATMPTAISPAALTDKTTGMELVFIKGGCYRMGDLFGDGEEHEKPPHEVCVSDFYLGKYEVTQAQWEKVMKDNPSEFKKCGKDCPVDNVNWHMVQEYIKKLNVISGKNYRLPTEAEWEYAARSGGKDEKWPGTNDATKVGQFAWYEQNSERMTHRIGLKKPNGLGLFDMSGNVREWCQDWYDMTYYAKSPKNNPPGGREIERAEEYGRRVQRGGDFENSAAETRTVYRNANTPGLQLFLYGFRLLLPSGQQ